jgi:phosphoglycerate dehydrogenase-like enzyme
MDQVLVTDSLFIGPDDESKLREAGYVVERLDKPKASEEELVLALKGKVGYILGGVEVVTERVVAAAENLRAIAFTGSGYQEFIPGWKAATARGIAISAAIGGNAESVAEWSLVAGLAQLRRIPALSAPGGPSFAISREFRALMLGVVGFGHVGRAVASKAQALGITVLATPSKREPLAGVRTLGLSELLEAADIVSVHVDKAGGVGALNAGAIEKIKRGAVVVNAAFRDAIDNDALVRRLVDGGLVAAVDYPLAAPGAPAGALIASNGQTAFNTAEANARISSRAAASLINLLRTGSDPDLVNPEYRDRGLPA